MSNLSNKKIGITGTIGSGKSSVTKIISKYYKTLSADEIVSDLYKDSDVIKLVNKEILNSQAKKIDKVKLARVIFNNHDLKEKLESIIHPLVKLEVIKFLEENEGLVFVEVPLLFEAKFEDLFDKIILVVSNEEVIIKRLMKYRNYSLAEAKKRISFQFSVEEKLKKSNYIIENNQDLIELENKTIMLLKELEVEDEHIR